MNRGLWAWAICALSMTAGLFMMVHGGQGMKAEHEDRQAELAACVEDPACDVGRLQAEHDLAGPPAFGGFVLGGLALFVLPLVLFGWFAPFVAALRRR